MALPKTLDGQIIHQADLQKAIFALPLVLRSKNGRECDPVLHGKYKMHLSNFKALEPKEYPKHGVTLHDDLPLQTSIAANLLSFYEVRGGPDAVAEEMNGLKERDGTSAAQGWPLEFQSA